MTEIEQMKTFFKTMAVLSSLTSIALAASVFHPDTDKRVVALGLVNSLGCTTLSVLAVHSYSMKERDM